MTPREIFALRTDLGLSQVEFGQLLGAHLMTVSKWEHGRLRPSAYQQALMQEFARTAAARREEAQETVKNLLIGAGVVAALVWLLTESGK